MTDGGQNPYSSVRYIAIGLFVVLMVLQLSGPTFAKNGDGSEHDYHNNPFTFLFFTFLMSFSTMAILVSLFSFKFGAKRSRVLAVPLMITGLVPWGIWILFNLILRAVYPDDTFLGIVHWVAAPLLLPLMALLGFVLGVGVALFIFLTIIVRS